MAAGSKCIDCEKVLGRELYGPELSSKESVLYSLLSTGEGKTISEVVEIMGVSNTETYYTLMSLQKKKLVRAIPIEPIKFIAAEEYRYVYQK